MVIHSLVCLGWFGMGDLSVRVSCFLKFNDFIMISSFMHGTS